jgi:carbamoyl-phosphate synthase small subunit
MTRALLALADGRVFEGRALGAEGEATGEVVFNTAMTGYQEILTDPSYMGQMVTMTYPLIGNYGVNNADVESRRPFVNGFIVREAGRRASNWRAVGTLDHYLRSHRIVGIEGLDTRALTRHIRDHGEQPALLSTEEADPKRLAERARSLPGLIGRDLVKEVTCAASYEWPEGLADRPKRTSSLHVVVYDFGVKFSILRSLVSVGCRVTVVPAQTTAKAVLALKPDGIVLSNGPGDPAALSYAIEATRALLGKRPLLGICLGHQLLGLALEATTYKLKFGHHGGNHPVMDLTTGKVEITTQNHGFGVRFGDPVEVEQQVRTPAELRQLQHVATPFGHATVTHVSLNDGTVEGLRCLDVPAFSVQYHPEASPGPHDAHHLFGRFVEMMARA